MKLKDEQKYSLKNLLDHFTTVANDSLLVIS